MQVKKEFLPALLLSLFATGCVPTPDPPDVKMSDGLAKNSAMIINFSNPHAILNPKAVARFKIKNYKACMPHGRDPSVGDTYPNPYKEVPLHVAVINDSIQLTTNLAALKDEDYYNKGICNWNLEEIQINYETSAPATYYQGDIRFASGKRSSGSYPVDYCAEEGVWMTCCDRNGKCSKSPKALPINPNFRVFFDTDGSDKEFDLICSQDGCYGPAKGKLFNQINMTASVRITSEGSQQ